jgi:hypothetical protein
MKLAKQTLCILIAAILLFTVFVPAAAASAATAASAAAVPLKSSVLVNGAQKSFDAYLIGDCSYFKLRDLAYVLSGTPKQFETSIARTRIDLISGAAYTPVGGEMEVSEAAKNAAAAPSEASIYLDGKKLGLTAYTIGAYNYIKLRDLAAALDFGVKYLKESGTIAIDTSAGYTDLSTLKVTMIGDSIGVSLGTYLKKHLPKLDNHSKECRQFYEAKGIAKKLMQSGGLADTVIIELGTNGTIKEPDMRALIDLLGSGRKIVFVNCQLPKSWGVKDNQLIAKVTADYPNTIIADWYGASLDKSGYFYSDHVHPTAAGAKVMAQVVADAVEKIQ